MHQLTQLVCGEKVYNIVLSYIIDFDILLLTVTVLPHDIFFQINPWFYYKNIFLLSGYNKENINYHPTAFPNTFHLCQYENMKASCLIKQGTLF